MTRRYRRLAAIALAMVATAASAQSGRDGDAADEGAGNDLDTLFDAEIIEDESGEGNGDAAGAAPGGLEGLFDSEVVESAVPGSDASTGAAPEEALLTRAGVDWGGSFRYAPEVELGFASNDALAAALRGEGEAERALRHDLAAELYFDARPSSDFRAFGKAKVDYTLPATGGSEFTFTLFELFADFHWDDLVFFRAGKQRADWGVGRFFSPADLMSLVTIDPLAPDAEREGPVALKVHAPLGVHNAYLYVVTGDYRDPLDVAVGARGELVVGGVELGAGGLIQANLVPKAIATATGAVGDFDLFAEAVIQRGTERNLVELDAAGRLKVTGRDERSEEWFPAATVGALYFAAEPGIALAAQYYYNPLGYPDSAALAPARAALRAPDGTGPPRSGPRPEVVDLLFFGRHYAGASAAWNGIADSDFSAAVFWLANLSDGSGIVRPSLTWRVLEYARLSLGASLGYGTGATEYGERVAFTLGAALGVGSF